MREPTTVEWSAWLHQARSEVARVRRLHHPTPGGDTCHHDTEPFPCPTIRAIEESW